VTATLIPVKGTDIWLVSLMGFAVLLLPVRTKPNVMLEAERVTGAIPVPETLMLMGLPEALLVTTTAALKLPLAVGAKLTLMVHLLPTARLEGQLFDSGNAKALLPVTTILEIATAEPPVFVTVIGSAAVLVPKA